MLHFRLSHSALALPLLAITGIASGQVAHQHDADDADHISADELAPRATRLVIPMPNQTATVVASGEALDMPCQEIWKPICSNRAEMTVDDLAQMAATHAFDFPSDSGVTIIDSDDGFTPRAGLNLVYSLGPSVPAAAIPAFAAAEAYLEAQFPNDPITVTVTVSFASLGSGIIGGTSSAYGYVDWATTRSVLVSGMDATDTIQSSLPGGTTIPVRYSSGSTTNEDRVFFTFANWKAAGGTVAGTDASMQYSTNFPFDFDPSNGVTANTISLQDVIVHETGHALGFGSGVDFRVRDIETLDIFRFRRTDGASDFNPDTAAEFTARPRWAVFNNPNDDVNFDDIGASEYRLSDGSPWQASHFREQVPAIGIMDPAFSYGETFWPNFLRTSDVTAFDAIGWNR